MTVFTLPSLPPPLSACFTNVARNGRAATQIYRDWTISALWAIKAQRVKPVLGNVTVHYQMQRPSRRKMDLANREKGLSDVMVKAGIIEDDSRIIDLRLSWGGEHPVTITVLPAE